MASTMSCGSFSSRTEIFPVTRMALFSRMYPPLSLSTREKHSSSMEAVSSSRST